MLGKQIREQMPVTGAQAYVQGLVDDLRAAWSLPQTGHQPWLSPRTYADVYKYFINDLVRPGPLSYSDRLGATSPKSTFAQLVSSFQSDYYSDGEVWFFYPFFSKMQALAQAVDTFLADPASFSDRDTVTDSTLMSGSGGLADTYVGHIPWLTSVLGANLSTRWASPAVEVYVGADGLKRELANSLSSKVGYVIDKDRIAADEFCDLVIYGLAHLFKANNTFSYSLTKARYKAKSELVLQGLEVSVPLYFLSYGQSLSVATIAHVL